jgi:hypothetical protein
MACVELASAAVARQPLGVAVLVDQHHRPELRRQLVQASRPDHLPSTAKELAGLRINGHTFQLVQSDLLGVVDGHQQHEAHGFRRAAVRHARRQLPNSRV